MQKTTCAGIVLFVLAIISGPTLAQSDEATVSLSWNSPLVIVEGLWLALVAIGAPYYASRVGKKDGKPVNISELRGLNLPRGSIRGILALLAVGSFVIVMVLGAPVLGGYFDTVLAAFGTLTGSIIGFYFGNRSATPKPGERPEDESPGAI